MVEGVRERADAVRTRAERFRAHHPRIDRLMCTTERFNSAQATQHAGAVTYFGLLSFFPVLAIGFFAVGLVSSRYPGAESALMTALESVLPGVFGPSEEGRIPLETVQQTGSAVGLVGLVVLLYAGLGWLSAMRKATAACFDVTYDEQPGFLVGKVRDLISLLVLGLVLVISVPVASLLRAFGVELLDLLHWSQGLAWLLTVGAWAFSFTTSMVLFLAIFRVLARPQVPVRALLQGALLGAVGFEALKWLSTYLLAATRAQPAFQAFGIALILLVWINWFARIALFSACWAYTAPSAVAARAAAMPPEPLPLPPPVPRAADEPWAPALVFGAGAGAMLALVAFLRRAGRR